MNIVDMYASFPQGSRRAPRGEGPSASEVPRRDGPTVPPSRGQSPTRDETSRPPSLIDAPPPTAGQPRPAPKRRFPRKQHPQKTVDDFWYSFTSKTPGKPYSLLPDNYYAKHAATHAPKGVRTALASYDEAKANCEAKVAKIVKECRRTNQKYTDPHFNIEADFRRWGNERPFSDCLMGLLEVKTELRPQSVKRVEDIFENPQFFIDGATANDVRQGKEGDCWFMSALCTLSNKKGLIQSVCVARDEKVGVYGFVFHRDGEWISEVIDDKLYLIKEDFNDATLERNKWLELQNRTSPEEEYRTVMQTGSRALYFAQCSDPNETWLPLLEKAYAKAHGDYAALESGFVGEAIEDLTGGVTTEIFSTDILDKDKFWNDELMNVNQTFLFGCGQMGGKHGMRNGILEKHAYSILEAREVNGQRLLKLRNPWGNTEWKGSWSDGSAEWTPEWMQLLNHKFGDDGVFWISYKDLLRNYQHIDRTRLFGSSWKVISSWTSLEVPWSVDYLDTRFDFSLEKGGEVVIVLQQLDDRFFRGLEGQYDFHLQFRLHKEDEEEYIVRSNPAYYMKRSVSTELELEAGQYTVLVKITAKRYPNDPTVEEVVAATCQMRREKLLNIGLSYDLAHAKGEFREVEHEKKDHEQKERRVKRRDTARKMHAARVLQHKKQKFRNMKIGMKKEAKAIAKMQRQADAQAKQEAMEKQMEEMKFMTEPESVPDGLGINGSGLPANGGGPVQTPARRQDSLDKEHHPHAIITSPPLNGRPRRDTRPSSLSISSKPGTPSLGSSSRRDTLEARSVSLHQAAHGVPGIQVHRPSVPNDQLTLSDISDDDLSWDSDLDAPEDSDADDFGPSDPYFGGPSAQPKQDDEEEYARDPWNAVCVVGLRIYTKDSGVNINVVRSDSKNRPLEEADIYRRGLDVDDASKDPSREPVSPISPSRQGGMTMNLNQILASSPLEWKPPRVLSPGLPREH